ncbi:hypothetical protein LY76DRAFT_311385 [Colletotrichum caudatum]|nr:hypothetical protein LY76DRAFT_311385 [Colletotrichum caudatum]
MSPLLLALMPHAASNPPSTRIRPSTVPALPHHHSSPGRYTYTTDCSPKAAITVAVTVNWVTYLPREVRWFPWPPAYLPLTTPTTLTSWPSSLSAWCFPTRFSILSSAYFPSETFLSLSISLLSLAPLAKPYLWMTNTP